MFLVAITSPGCATRGPSISETAPLPTKAVIDEQASSLSTEDEIHNMNDGEAAADLAYDPFAEPGEDIDEYDPWEAYNVLAFEFNYRLDKYLIKPVARVYNFFIPPDVQQSIFNAIQNLRTAPRFLNNIFQAKFSGAGIELSRFAINSTLGVGGLFDPATYMFDMETPDEDTGQTLAVYGMPAGPYLVIPFLGSFTVRDGVGYIGDLFLDPFNWLVLPLIEIADAPRLVTHDTTITLSQLGYRSGETVNFRALNLERFQGVEEGTVDLYGAVRNAYLQKRAKAIRE
ncbi:MAG: VacJ family lipoprotein [Nitrospirae bacterium]|nr:MAG: VacJ family lipoprotein [Nitrospirota bacterium]